MYFHVIRRSIDGQFIPIAYDDWQQLVTQDTGMYWTKNECSERLPRVAVYFIDAEDQRGMDWYLRDDGTFRFQNTRLSEQHPYIKKIYEVAAQLKAEVIQHEQADLSCLFNIPIGPVAEVQPDKLSVQATALEIKSVAETKTNQVVPTTLTVPTGLSVVSQGGYSFDVVEVKPQRPKNLPRIRSKLRENSQITHLRLYTSDHTLFIGESFQGEIVAPITWTREGITKNYQVPNIWVDLVAVHQTSYTFRIQATFMVELPKVAYLYQEGSKIVLEQQAISLWGKR